LKVCFRMGAASRPASSLDCPITIAIPADSPLSGKNWPLTDAG